MHYVSWNVNGLRAAVRKGFMERFDEFAADAVCLQETKMQAHQMELDLPGCYTPNSQRELTRLDYRMTWEDAFRAYLLALNEEKPVVLCGDLNVAHKEIDLKNPKTNRRNAGFTDEERGMMTKLLDAGFTDSFRYLYPDAVDAYTWWSYFAKSRERNVGWRIDYFLVSDRLAPKIQEARIYPEVMGSDHCPVDIVLDLGR